jgi:ABC-type multidrug transport system permease subunit
MKPFLAIFVRELLILRRKFLKQLLAYVVPPTLFIVAFGWAFRDRISMGGVPYIMFILPGIMAMSSMRQSFSLSTDINISRFYWRTFDEIRSTPISDLSYTIGEVLSGMVKGWLATLVILLIALFFRAAFPLSGLFVLSVTLNTLIFSSIAVITSMLVRSHADQGILTNFVITPMAFLCGTFFPLEMYPRWVRWIIYILPLTHSTRTIRAAYLGDPYPFYSLLYMIIAASLCFVTGVLVIKKSKD